MTAEFGGGDKLEIHAAKMRTAIKRSVAQKVKKYAPQKQVVSLGQGGEINLDNYTFGAVRDEKLFSDFASRFLQ